MVFSSLGGLRSCATRGAEFSEGNIDITNDETRGLLDEALLSPVHSSEMNSPVRAPTQTWVDIVRKHQGTRIKNKPLPKQSSNAEGNKQETIEHPPKQSSNAEVNKWETIETTVVFDNGNKETVLDSNVPPTQEFRDVDESCTERCWDCIEGIIFRIFCCNKSFKTAEVYKNMSDVFNKVDHVASRVFPFTFLIINIAYWALYIYIL